MLPNGMDTIYSTYVGNTAASSSTTMIVPSCRQPSDNDEEEGEMVAKKEVNDDVDYDHSLDIKKQKQPHYHYNSLKHPHTPLCQLHHQDKHTPMLTPLSTTTSIPIPFSPASATTHYASSYFPTVPSCNSAPVPLRTTSIITSISAPVAPSMTLTSKSPKKKVKRWIVAALMIIVGLLIALTFILIGLGKAFSQPHHHTNAPSSSLPIQSQFIYATATATDLLVSPVHLPSRL